MIDYFGKNMAQADLGRASLRGGVVSIAARLVSAIVQVGSVIILARLLSPEDYGLVAMATAIVGIVPLLIDLGSRDAVIQQDHITPGEISALFWITLGIGLLLAIIVAASGPLIALFYGEPRLTPIAVVSAFSLIGLALSYQHQALMRRAMLYRELAIIDIISNLVSTIVAIIMAFRGFGYWSLAVRPLISSIVQAIGSWLRCRWIPGKPHFTKNVAHMIKFGVHWIGFSAADFVGKFADRIAIGYAHGALNLGFYQKACLIYDNSLDLFTSPLHSVAATGLSKLRDNPQALWRSWAKGLSTLAFFAMPAFGLLSVVSRDVIVMLLGQKWQPASVLVGILALRGIPHVIERTVGWLHAASGRADRFMRWGLVQTAVQLIALLIGLPFGTQGVAWSYVVSTFLLVLPAITYSGRPLGIGIRQVIGVIGHQMLGTLLAVGFSLVLRETLFVNVPVLWRTLFLVLCFASAYFVIVVGLFKVWTPLLVGRSLLRERFA